MHNFILWNQFKYHKIKFLTISSHVKQDYETNFYTTNLLVLRDLILLEIWSYDPWIDVIEWIHIFECEVISLHQHIYEVLSEYRKEKNQFLLAERVKKTQKKRHLFWYFIHVIQFSRAQQRAHMYESVHTI